MQFMPCSLAPVAGIAELLDIRCEGFPWCWNHYLGVISSGGSCETSCLHMGTARNINLLQLGADLDNPDHPNHSGPFSPSHLSLWFREEGNKIPWN